MKDFIRNDSLFSLCGLNCALCTMKLGGYCPGCCGGEGNQGCSIARCSLEQSGGEPGRITYCFECPKYPCQRYEGIDQYDSFITHRHQLTDMDRAKIVGILAYHAQLNEKEAILQRLLAEYNDGRRKTFFALAVNLLELADLQAVMEEADGLTVSSMTVKEKALATVECFEKMAKQRGVVLRLNKKKK